MDDTESEREQMLASLHPFFREVDEAVSAYVHLTKHYPNTGVEQIREKLIAKGIESKLATDCITFVPLGFGRIVVDSLGVNAANSYQKQDETGNLTTHELSKEFTFVWAKYVSRLYQASSQYHDAFAAIASQSAEVDAINNALHNGITEDKLRESSIPPVVISSGQHRKQWWQFW